MNTIALKKRGYWNRRDSMLAAVRVWNYVAETSQRMPSSNGHMPIHHSLLT